jgi:hypothetical protein
MDRKRDIARKRQREREGERVRAKGRKTETDRERDGYRGLCARDREKEWNEQSVLGIDGKRERGKGKWRRKRKWERERRCVGNIDEM